MGWSGQVAGERISRHGPRPPACGFHRDAILAGSSPLAKGGRGCWRPWLAERLEATGFRVERQKPAVGDVEKRPAQAQITGRQAIMDEWEGFQVF